MVSVRGSNSNFCWSGSTSISAYVWSTVAWPRSSMRDPARLALFSSAESFGGLMPIVTWRITTSGHLTDYYVRSWPIQQVSDVDSYWSSFLLAGKIDWPGNNQPFTRPVNSQLTFIAWLLLYSHHKNVLTLVHCFVSEKYHCVIKQRVFMQSYIFIKWFDEDRLIRIWFYIVYFST